MSTNERIRGRHLQAIRAAHFRENPLCVHCYEAGRVTLATELDHIKSIANGGRDVYANRQGLCKDCHATKTAADMGHKPTGGDSTGRPTDPRHPWNQDNVS